jgi:hypothetical protein
MGIEFTKTHETWQFDLGQRDGGMIAIMCNEENDPSFHAVYDLPIDVTQQPMTWMGVYPTYIVQVDTDDCETMGIDLDDLREALLLWIDQKIQIAYRYNPLDRRPNHNDTTYILQRRAVMQMENHQ